MKWLKKLLTVMIVICMVFTSWPILAHADGSNADLSGINTSAGSLSPSFDAQTIEYNLALPSDTGNVTLTPQKADENAALKINGAIQDSITLQLSASETKDAVIEVSSQDGSTQKTYTVHASCAQAANAGLSGITVSAGNLSPSFEVQTTEYSLALPADTNSVRIMPQKADENATLKINGAAQDSITLQLNNGQSKDAAIEVTGQDGSTQKTYTVHVSRAQANAGLSSITVSTGNLSPSFDPFVTEYDLVLADNIIGVAITAIKAENGATVKINGVIQDGVTIMLNNGEQKVVSIEVTEKDGTTKKTYTVHVSRQWSSSTANLSNLTVSNGFLYPQFNASTLSYKVLLGAMQADTTLQAVLQDPSGQASIGGTPGSQKLISVGNGETKQVQVKSTSQDGTATMTYTVDFYRQKAGDPVTIDSNLFTPRDIQCSTDSATIYLSDNAGKRIFAFNLSTGDIRSIPVPYAPGKMAYAGGTLLVALSNPQSNLDEVAIIDPATFTLSYIMDVNTDITYVAGDASNIYVSGSGNISAYSRSTREKTSSIPLYIYNLQVNPVTGSLYVVTGSSICSCQVTNGLLGPVKQINMTTGSQFAIMPDGKHLVTSDGSILICSTDSTQDLLVSGKLISASAVAVDNRNNEVYLMTDRLIQVYDASDFHFKRVIPESIYLTYIFSSDGYLVLGQKNSSNGLVFSAVNADTLLKSITINGEPFTEFYPAHPDVVKGNVPYAMDSADIEGLPVKDNAVVSGDTGTQRLAVGKNIFNISVRDPDSGRTKSYTLTITRLSSDPPPVTLDARVKLGFTPMDMALDPDRAVAYLTAKDGYSLYRINLQTGEIAEKKFDIKAERLIVKNGKAYVTLPRQPHSYYNFDGWGSIAVIDTATFTIERIFNVNIDPYDIEADSSGYVYVSPGSGQWSEMYSFDSQTGRQMSVRSSVRNYSMVEYNTVCNKIYSLAADGSIVLSAFEINDGVLTKNYSGSYSSNISSYMRISPDGKYLFFNNGYLYSCKPTSSGDMAYVGNIGKSFNTICFDMANSKFFTARDKTLTTYNYDTRKEVYSYTSIDDFTDIKHNGSRIVALQKKSSGDYYINYLDDTLLREITLNGSTLQGFNPSTIAYNQTFDTDNDSITIGANALMDGSAVSGDTGTLPLSIGDNTYTITATGVQSGQMRTYTLHILRRSISDANLSAINCSEGAFSPAFSADTMEYSLMLDKDTVSSVITPKVDKNGASFRIDGVAAPNKSVSLGIGQAQDVTIVVTAANGATRTYTVHVRRQSGNQAVTLPAGFTPSDMKVSPDGLSIFMTGSNQRVVYKADCSSGKVISLTMPGVAKKLGFVNGELLVTVEVPEFNQFYIGIIDPASFTLTGQFQVDTDYIGLTGDSNYYYFYANSTIVVYSKATHQKLSSTNANYVNDMEINPRSGYLYTCSSSYGYVSSYGMVNGQLQFIKSYGNYSYSYNSLTILPDGRNLMLNDGTILTCSTNKDLDLQYTTKIPRGANFTADTGANEIYAAEGRLIAVYNASDFNFKRMMPETATVNNLFCSGNRLVIVQKDASDTLSFHSVCPGTLLKSLKINGEPFSEFYPAQVIIDRGPVPNAMQHVEISAEAVKSGAVVTGTGVHDLSLGENVIAISVTDPGTSGSQTYYLIFNRSVSDLPAQTSDVRTSLGFVPKDVAIDPDRPVEYMTAVNGKSLYRVNYETGEISEKKFDFAAESIAVKNGKVYVTLIKQPLSSTSYGAVAVIDSATFMVDKILSLNCNPFDMEADAQGRVYITSYGSDTQLYVFDTASGRTISSYNSWYQIYLESNTVLNKLYAVDTGVSPMDLFSYELSNGVITKGYDSPYHGDYYLTTCMKVSPDGKFIFNGYGNIFNCMPTQTGDMVYNGTLGKQFTAICFDLNSNAFYTGSDKTLTAYDYDTRNVRYTMNLAASVINLQQKSGTILAVLKKNNGDYYISNIQRSEENATLSGINTSTGEITPAFDTNTTSYTLTYNASSVTITPAKSLTTQTVKIDGDIVPNVTLTLLLGESKDVPIEVTAPDGVTKNTYQLHVVRLKSTNADLTNITTLYGTLTPAFDKNTQSYSVSLASSQSYTTITVSKAVSAASVRMNGQTTMSYSVSIGTGASYDVSIYVTAEDGTIPPKNYTVHITRASSNSPYLSNISSSSGLLSPSFSSSTYEYTATLPAATSATMLSATKADGAATVRMDGEAAMSKVVAVDPGTTKNMTIEVTAQDGVTKKTYIVHVTRQVSSNAALSGLTVSSGLLSPAFTTGTYEYTLKISSTTTGTTLYPSLADGTATIQIDGTAGTGRYFSMSPGEKKDVSIVVMAQDGITQKTYTIHLARDPYSTNASLSALTTSGGTLQPSFTANTLEYSITLPNSVPSTSIAATKAESNATMKFDGAIATSKNVTLAAGTGQDVVIEVTAQDGVTVKTYKVHIYRAEKRVTGVSLSQHTLTLTNGDTYALTATAEPQDATNQYISWTSSDTNIATVSNGAIAAVGPGKANITVTTQDGGFTDKCTVNVEPRRYTISAGASDPSCGTVTGNGVYDEGSQVTLRAAPKPGYRFVRWTQNGTEITANTEYVITVTADTDLTAEFVAIGIPANVSAVPAAYDCISVKWDRVDFAAGYEVWRSTTYNGNYTKVLSTSATAFTDTGLSTNTTYYYKVAAYCISGSTTTSGSQSAYTGATPVLKAPSIATAPTGYDSAVITWNTVPGANGYQVYRSVSENGAYAPITTTTSTSYTNTKLNTGATYYFKVGAYRNAGSKKVTGSLSASSSATLKLDAVTGVSAVTNSVTGVRVAWNAVNGRSGYEVWRSTAADTGYTLVKSTTSSYLNDTNLAPNITYYYQIRAYRDVSKARTYGGFSGTANAMPVFNAVTGTTAGMYSATSIKISWNAVAGRKSYEIWRSTSPDSGFILVKATTATIFIDKNLMTNTTYYYKVRAYCVANGNRYYSADSNTANATPVLAAVTGATASKYSAAKIKLAWSSVPDKSGYEIWRSTSATGDFTLIASQTSTTYYDINVMAGTTYYYKIRAYRLINNVRIYGEYSPVIFTGL